MIKTLIIGLDLSFSSTGIAISYLEDKIGKTIQFHRLVFDENKNVKKQYVPTPIENINQVTYRMPTNILPSDLVIDDENNNNQMQIETTLKAMIASKKIANIIFLAIKQFNPDNCVFVIENYIMPQYTGAAQLKTVSGLIMLQGFVRAEIIKFGIDFNLKVKLMTPTPSNNKLFFAKNGSADKSIMLKAFIENYDGKKLIPSADIHILGRIDDVVDGFSLMMQGFATYIKDLVVIQTKLNPNIIEL